MAATTTTAAVVYTSAPTLENLFGHIETAARAAPAAAAAHALKEEMATTKHEAAAAAKAGTGEAANVAQKAAADAAVAATQAAQDAEAAERAAAKPLADCLQQFRSSCPQCGGQSCTATPLHRSELLNKTGVNKDGLLPLAYAATVGSVAAARVLVENGASLTAEALPNSPPPLHVAILLGNQRVCQYFADLPQFSEAWKLRSSDGVTASDAAADCLPPLLFQEMSGKVKTTMSGFWPFNRRSGAVPPAAIPRPAGNPPAAKAAPAHDDPAGPPRRRILVMDGGGSRGVVMVQMLQTLLGGREPHEVFDLICGTSTGGIMAMALGVHKLPLERCKEMYTSFAAELFPCTNPAARLHRRFLKGGYSADRLVGILADDFGHQWITHQADASPRVFAVAANPDGPWGYTPALFCNYELPPNPPGVIPYDHFAYGTTVEACRATSAAPTYFAPFEIDNRTFYDGGLAANNPVNIAIDEAHQLWGPGCIEYIVSLGTGECVPETQKTFAKMDGPAVLFNAVASATEHNSAHMQALLRLLPRQGILHRLDPGPIDAFPQGQPLDVGNAAILTRMSDAGRRRVERYERRGEIPLTNRAADVPR